MSVELLNFIETVLNGLMSGVMYSLVALGFVLIFKASGVFNFAQGVFALFAALTLVGYQTGQVPFAHLINELFGTNYHNWYASMPNFLAIILTMITMIALAWIIERLVLKHLVNQDPIILFMATIGLAFALEGVGDLMPGTAAARVRSLPWGHSLVRAGKPDRVLSAARPTTVDLNRARGRRFRSETHVHPW